MNRTDITITTFWVTSMNSTGPQSATFLTRWVTVRLIIQFKVVCVSVFVYFICMPFICVCAYLLRAFFFAFEIKKVLYLSIYLSLQLPIYLFFLKIM